MKSFKEIIIEAKNEDKLLIVDKTLWFTYAPNSGKAIPFSSKTYFTDKKGDSNYEPNIISKMVKYSKLNKPLKEKGNLKLYFIPVYKTNKASNYDIWGGKEKPIKEKYAILSTGKINVLTMFNSKNEALNWIKTTA